MCIYSHHKEDVTLHQQVIEKGAYCRVKDHSCSSIVRIALGIEHCVREGREGKGMGEREIKERERGQSNMCQI